MKNILAALFGLSTMAALTTTAFAQNEAVKVQFEQTVRTAQSYLPAGNYIIRLANLTSDQPILAIESDHGARVLVPAMRASAPGAHGAASTEVVLERVGNELHITKIWLAGRASGYEVIGSSAPNR
jgi:hypothetical protein